jgi:Ala-tRNA(Pro) deacylase
VSTVMEYLQGRGVAFLVLPDPMAERPEDAARKHGFSVDEVVRTAVIAGRFGHSLMVIPASRELDLDLVKAALDDPEARVASERDMARSFPDYETGSLPPLGLFFLAPMYVDPAVANSEAVIFHVGRVSLGIRMPTRDLFRDDPIVVAPLTRGSAEPEPDVIEIPEVEADVSALQAPHGDARPPA